VCIVPVNAYSKAFSELPWMPDSRIVSVPQRGEFFVRYAKHENVNAPVVALLHGWTGNADINFFLCTQNLFSTIQFLPLIIVGMAAGCALTTDSHLKIVQMMLLRSWIS